MKERKVLASLLLGGVILLASYMVAGWYSDGIFVRWQALGSPPGGPGEMITGYMEISREAAMSVILAAFDGTYERGALPACDAVDCWEPVRRFAKAQL